MDATDRLGRIAFQLATGDEDARACRDIDDAQCRDQPRNFGLTLFALTATKAGDEFASARLVLAWVMAAVGAPEFMLALLVPIRESGALLPQLVVAAIIRRQPLRKWFWAAGSVAQGLCVLGMAAVAVTLEGAAAGWALLGLLTLFALARGVCSVSFKDVLGKTVDKGKRGSLTGWATSTAGFAAIGAGLLMQSMQDVGVSALALLLAAAGTLWLLGAGLYAAVAEEPGATEGGANALGEALASLRLLRDDAAFRDFCITRALLLSTALAFPFYVLLANQSSNGGSESAGVLGTMVAASGLAGLLAAPFWGRWADHSSRQVMVASALLAAALGAVTVTLAQSGWLAQGGALAGGWAFVPIYFVMAVSHHGVRIARSTYLVDLGDSQTRAAYTAVSNTLIGVLLLLGSSVGLLAEWLGASGVIAILSGVALLAAASAWRLQEV